MAEVRYTQKEYEDAMELLRQRLRNELSMTHDIESLFDEYAEYIIAALSNGATEADIELLIEDLILRIMDDCRTLAVDEHEVDDSTLALIFDGDEMSVEERVKRRARTFLDEVTTAFSAGEILQMDDASILASVKESMEHPWDNELIKEVRGMIERGEVAGDVEYYEERHYGKGVPVSSRLDMEFITASAVAETWNEWEWKSALNGGAKGYYIVRGSSYPCEECDSHTGRFFDINDKEHLPQYHRSCKCFVVYCYENDMI